MAYRANSEKTDAAARDVEEAMVSKAAACSGGGCGQRRIQPETNKNLRDAIVPLRERVAVASAEANRNFPMYLPIRGPVPLPSIAQFMSPRNLEAVVRRIQNRLSERAGMEVALLLNNGFVGIVTSLATDSEVITGVRQSLDIDLLNRSLEDYMVEQAIAGMIKEDRYARGEHRADPFVPTPAAQRVTRRKDNIMNDMPTSTVTERSAARELDCDLAKIRAYAKRENERLWERAPWVLP